MRAADASVAGHREAPGDAVFGIGVTPDPRFSDGTNTAQVRAQLACRRPLHFEMLDPEGLTGVGWHRAQGGDSPLGESHAKSCCMRAWIFLSVAQFRVVPMPFNVRSRSS